MRQDIMSIPVSEVFEPREGCPLCRLRDMLENRVVDNITGAAMMEPDVRQETNRLGFCYPHYQKMLKKQNRLGVGLILESHLEELDNRVFDKSPIFGKSSRRQSGSAEILLSTCFVCGRIDWSMERMLLTICRLWESERDFRRLFEEQQVLCLPHFSLLTHAAQDKMSKKAYPDFHKACAGLCREYLTKLRADVSHFCRMFDYRNTDQDADWGDSRDSIERAVWWLTSYLPK